MKKMILFAMIMTVALCACGEVSTTDPLEPGEAEKMGRLKVLVRYATPTRPLQILKSRIVAGAGSKTESVVEVETNAGIYLVTIKPADREWYDKCK